MPHFGLARDKTVLSQCVEDRHNRLPGYVIAGATASRIGDRGGLSSHDMLAADDQAVGEHVTFLPHAVMIRHWFSV